MEEREIIKFAKKNRLPAETGFRSGFRLEFFGWAAPIPSLLAFADGQNFAFQAATFGQSANQAIAHGMESARSQAKKFGNENDNEDEDDFREP